MPAQVNPYRDQGTAFDEGHDIGARATGAATKKFLAETVHPMVDRLEAIRKGLDSLSEDPPRTIKLISGEIDEHAAALHKLTEDFREAL